MIDSMDSAFIAISSRKIPCYLNEHCVQEANMDKIDLKILEQLQVDGRASAQQLSEHVGLSAAPVWRRVKALESAKVI